MNTASAPETLPDQDDEQEGYLPDFCAGGMVLAIVLIAELVAIIFTLARHTAVLNFWADLARTSMFLLWIGLWSAFVLCRSQPFLSRYGAPGVTLGSLLLLLSITAAVSEGAYWLGQYFTMTSDAAPGLFPASHQGFLLRNLIISGVVSLLVLRYFYVSHQWRRNVQMEARSRISALQARIRPHFLFNSMNTIAALIASNPDTAEQAVEDLSDLFRASLADSRQMIRISEEFEMARVYQRIEQLRLGDRLKVVWNVDAVPVTALLPALSVQPLLENAIYHGIEPLADGGTVTINGTLAKNRITIEVSNPVAAEPSASDHRGNRMALANIGQRFDLSFGGKARMDVEQLPQLYTVRLIFPYQDADS